MRMINFNGFSASSGRGFSVTEEKTSAVFSKTGKNIVKTLITQPFINPCITLKIKNSDFEKLMSFAAK